MIDSLNLGNSIQRKYQFYFTPNSVSLLYNNHVMSLSDALTSWKIGKAARIPIDWPYKRNERCTIPERIRNIINKVQ